MVDERKPENPEEALRRMVAEEEELSTDPLVSDMENAGVVRSWLKQKHDAEFDTGAPFETILDSQRYEAHKKEGEQFSADARVGRSIGEIVPVGDDRYVYMGVDDQERGVLRPLQISPEITGEWQALPDITFSVEAALKEKEEVSGEEVVEETETQSVRHIPRTAPAPDIVGEVAMETTENDIETIGGEPENERWRGVVGHINRIDILAGDKQRAIRALRNGKELGLTTKADNLERSLAKFPEDESAMTDEELEEKRRITAEYESMIGREMNARNDAEFFNRAMYDEIDLVLRRFDQLPEELQGGIRDGKDEIFRKYDINPWAAQQVAEALKEREYEEERELHAMHALRERMQKDLKEGRPIWKSVASVIGSPQFAVFSRDDIEHALTERGIAVDDIGSGVKLLREQYEAEQKSSAVSVNASTAEQTTETEKKTHQVPAGTFVKGSQLSGVYEVRDGHVFNAGDTAPNAVKLDEATTVGAPEVQSEPRKPEKESAPLVERWNAGHEEYSQFADAERYADAQFERTVKLWRMRSAKQKPIRYKKVKAVSDPTLTGIYEETDGAIVNDEGIQVARLATKVVPPATVASPSGKFSPEVESLLQPLSDTELKELNDMKDVDVDPTLSGEALEGFDDRQMNKFFGGKGNRITIKPGTLASDALTSRRSVLSARASENIAYGEDAAKSGRTAPVEISDELRVGLKEQHDDLEQSSSLAEAITSQNEIYDHAPSIITEAIARNNAMLDEKGSYADALAARNARLGNEPIIVSTKKEHDGKTTKAEPALEDSASEYYNSTGEQYLNDYLERALEAHDGKGMTAEDRFAAIKKEIEEDAKMVRARGRNNYADALLAAIPRVRAMLFPKESTTQKTEKVDEVSKEKKGTAKNVSEAVVSPEVDADTLPGVQRDYFARSAAITRELGEASLRADAKRVSELEQERAELEAWYATELKKYEQNQPFELDEIGSLWASFIEREYGLDVNGNPVGSVTEDEGKEVLSEKAMIDTADLWASFYDREHGIDIFGAPEKRIPSVLGTEPIPSASAVEVAVEIPAVIDIDPALMNPEGVDLDVGTVGESATTDDVAEAQNAWNPEHELAKVLKASRGERKTLLLQYKEKLAWQKLGLAKVQEQMVDEIRNAPEMTEEDFSRIFVSRASSYQATKEQVSEGLLAFRRYKRKHDVVEQYAGAFKNEPKEAYEVCFGAKPVGEIEMIVGPASLYFRCHNDEDYARIHSASGANAVTPEDLARANRTTGVVPVFTKIPELAGAVMVERAAGRPFDDESRKNYVHEEQHILHEILSTDQVREFDYQENNAAEKISVARLMELSDSIREGKTEEEKVRARKEMVSEMESLALIEERQIRAVREKYADRRAADEILAFMREGAAGDHIFASLTQKKADGGIYDFLNGERIDHVLGSSTSQFSQEDLAKYPELVRSLDRGFAERKAEIFGQEYTDLIKEGIEVCGKLQKEGIKNGVIRGILEHEPLVRWKKVAERMLEHKPRQLNFGVVKQFEEKFGVHEGALESLGAFNNLSDGQQLLVLRNLEQLTLADIKKEAKDTQREEWKKAGFWRRAGQMIVSLGMKPEMRTAEIEQELLKKARGEGVDQAEAQHVMAKKLAHIESLAKVAELGPDVRIGAKGELSIAYASPNEIFGSLADKHLTAEHLSAIELYNDAANAFAKLPQEWGADTDALPWKDRRAYKQAKKAYEESREAMLGVFETKFTEEDPRRAAQRAMLAMNSLDEKVTLNQLFNTHPDAEEALADIKDTSTIWRAAKEFWKAKGMFVAYGAAVRAGVVAITGGVAAPIIAAGAVGGLAGAGIGARQAKVLINERRHDGRMSAEDEREEIEFTTYKKDAKGNPELDKKGEKIPVGKGKRKIREFTDANFFVDRIDRLTKKLEDTKDKAGRMLLEKKIAQTNALMQEKLAHGMINFGGSSVASGAGRKGETISNRLAFMQAMAKGAIETNVDKAKLEKEVERLVDLREVRITDMRKKEIRGNALKAAAWRAGFALAGAGIAHWLGAGETHSGGRGGAHGEPYDPDAKPTVGRGSDGALYDPDNAPRGTTQTPEGRGVEVLIERRVISPQEAEFVNAMSKKFHRALSLEEGRALWKTMPLDGSEPTEEYLKNTPAGRAQIDIIAKFFQRGKPLSDEEIAAIFKKEGFDPMKGRPLPDELGLKYNEELVFPTPKATSTPSAPSPVQTTTPTVNERGGVDSSWKLEKPQSPVPPPHPVPPPPPVHAPATEAAPAQVLTKPVAPAETISAARPAAPAPAEVAPTPRVATMQEVMKSVTDIETKAGRDLSGGEMVTIKSLKALEVNAANPEEVGKIVSAREALAGVMARKHAPLSPKEMYDTLKSFGLEKKVKITPDDELRGVLAS